MINQMGQNENTQNQFSDAIRELKVGKLLRKANITKSCGISAYEVFQFLLKAERPGSLQEYLLPLFKWHILQLDKVPSAPVCKSNQRFQRPYQTGTGKSAGSGWFCG